MLSYNQIKNKPTELRTFTGLDQAEFDKLLVSFSAVWQSQLDNKTPDTPRQRQAGGGRKAKLASLEDKLFFILFYLKVYPLQTVIAFLFGMCQGQANQWIHRLTAVLQSALQAEQLLPAREAQNLEQVLAECDSLEFILDGTERRCQRPTEPTEQKEHYSGKKKCHTEKNNLIVHADSQRVLYLSPTYPGCNHDKKIADEEQYVFPRHSLLHLDLGFQGYEAAEVIIFQPKKKPRGQERPLADKILNSIKASARVTVEHVIAGVKRCRIVKDVFRNTKAKFNDLVMELACGLHNFRVECRHTNPYPSLFSYFQ